MNKLVIDYPLDIEKTLPNYKCPMCSALMLIAQTYSKRFQLADKECSEGVQKVARFQCQQCNQVMTPVKL